MESSFDADHENFSGAGFYNVENSDTSFALWKLVSDQSASNAKLMVRYSNGGAVSRPMRITVDAGSYDVEFPPTAGWDVWDTVVVENVWIDALPFDFKMESLSSDGGPNIDMAAFDIAGVYREGCSPAEPPAKIFRVRKFPFRAKEVLNGSCIYDVSGSCVSGSGKRGISKGVYFF